MASETWTDGPLRFEATWVDADGHVLDGSEGAVWGEIWALDDEGRCLNRDYVITELGMRVREQRRTDR